MRYFWILMVGLMGCETSSANIPQNDDDFNSDIEFVWLTIEEMARQIDALQIEVDSVNLKIDELNTQISEINVESLNKVYRLNSDMQVGCEVEVEQGNTYTYINTGLQGNEDSIFLSQVPGGWTTWTIMNIDIIDDCYDPTNAPDILILNSVVLVRSHLDGNPEWTSLNLAKIDLTSF